MPAAGIILHSRQGLNLLRTGQAPAARIYSGVALDGGPVTELAKHYLLSAAEAYQPPFLGVGTGPRTRWVLAPNKAYVWNLRKTGSSGAVRVAVELEWGENDASA